MGEVIRGAEKHFHDKPPLASDYTVGSVFKCSCDALWVCVNIEQNVAEYHVFYNSTKPYTLNEWRRCLDEEGTRKFEDVVLNEVQPVISEVTPRWYSLSREVKYHCSHHGNVEKDHVHKHEEVVEAVRNYYRIAEGWVSNV